MTRPASLPFEPAAGRPTRSVGPIGRSPRASAARIAVVQLVASEAPVDVVNLPGGDWRGFREGALEVLGTLLATLAIGLSWAAFEAGRLAGEQVSQTTARTRTVDAAADRAVAPGSRYARGGSIGG